MPKQTSNLINKTLGQQKTLKQYPKKTHGGTITIKYESVEDIKAYHNGIINVIAKPNSNLNIILVNLIDTKSNNFLSIQNTLEGNAKVTYWIIDFGGKNSITNYYSNLKGNFYRKQ